MATRLSAAAPLSFCFDPMGSQATKNSKEMRSMMKNSSCGWAGNLLLMAELRKRILIFRDIIDLPPCDGCGPIHELAMVTVKDLHNLYPRIVPCNLTSEMEESSLNQALSQLYNALKYTGYSWAKNHKWVTNSGDDTNDSMESATLEQLSRRVLAKLNQMINIAKKMFDVMEEDEKNNEVGIQGSTVGDTLSESYSHNKISCPSPDTPTSCSPELDFSMKLGEFANASYSSPFLLPLRLQAVEKLRPVEMKNLSFNWSHSTSDEGHRPKKVINQIDDQTKAEMQDIFSELPAKVCDEEPKDSKDSDNLPKIPISDSNVVSEARRSAAVPKPPPPPLVSNPARTMPPSNLPSNGTAAPPPPVPLSKGSLPVPPAPMPPANKAVPPIPPPLGAAKVLRPKKCTKLKRSVHMGNMYRLLKAKVEGSSLNGKPSKARKSKVGGSAGENLGMADALAEMTKRSTYFQQIEDDVRNHAKSIRDIQAAINSFQTKEMAELLKFHKHVEKLLEKLTDETQVLTKFEGFPMKKLESLRTAAALFVKLEEIATSLENWKVMPPLAQLLDKVESYFNKIKGEIDTLERSKEEESKRFQSNNIHFDFNILVQIKESMVDLSSSCMELALKERRKAKAAENAESGLKTKGQSMAGAKMLWRAFQLAFRVYSFAGGQDDRADILTKELAHEIEIDPPLE